MDGSLWLESHLKADGPKCVVLAFLCCPDPYYCLILDSQFSLFFLFFWLMIWLNLCGFMRFGGIRRGRFNFWMESRVHKWPPMVLGSLLGKKDNTTHLGPSAFKERRSFPWPLVFYIWLTLNPIRWKVTELFYYIRLPLNPILEEVTKLHYYIQLPLNPILGEVTELFYYIRLPLNPILGEVTKLDYYIRLPLDPIWGEVTELL